MCLIIQKPAGATVPLELIRNAWADNSDGAGIMYQSDTGPIVYKIMPGDWADPATHIDRVLSAITDREVGVHFRFKTHGPVTADMAHPYPVAGGRAYLMHNGILPVGKDYSPTISDTLYYVRKNLDKIPGPDDMEFWRIVEADIQTSRFLIMYDGGQFVRLNPALWSQYKGLILSNTHSVPELSNWKRADDDAPYYDKWDPMWRTPRRSRFVNGYGVADRAATVTSAPVVSRAVVPVPAPSVADGSRELPIRLTRRERRILRDCLRLGHWGPFSRLGESK